jgi:hypothetical protein
MSIYKYPMDLLKQFLDVNRIMVWFLNYVKGYAYCFCSSEFFKNTTKGILHQFFWLEKMWALSMGFEICNFLPPILSLLSMTSLCQKNAFNGWRNSLDEISWLNVIIIRWNHDKWCDDN